LIRHAIAELLVGIEMLHTVVTVGLVGLRVHVITWPYKAPLSVRTNRFLEGGPATLDNNCKSTSYFLDILD
jgi:hypothetical protein